MKSNIDNSKDCLILLDWLLLHDNTLSVREIYNHLVCMGFDFPSTLAYSYSFFLSEFHVHKNNPNIERVLVCLQSMIIIQYMEFYNFYPGIDSSGLFGYSSRRA